MTALLLDAPPAALLAHASWTHKDRMGLVVEELEIALAWADAHSTDPVVEVEGGDRLVTLGGDGTPTVRDLCLEELAVARREHVASTRAAMADALDLRHRLPRLWTKVRLLEVEAWVARKVAVMSRKLDRDAVALVDQAVAGAVGQAPSRVLAIAEAKVIEADIEGRLAELSEARRAKGAWLGGGRRGGAGPEPQDAGLRMFYARVEAADAIWADATVQRVADILAADPELRRKHHPELGEAPTMDELRAAAFGWLARPHDLAELLGLIEAQDQDQKAARRPRVVLYVHLHQAALEGVAAVARLEGRHGAPLVLDQVRGLLRHAHVDLKPVIDLNQMASVNGYEHPESVKERTRLRTGGDVFPHAASLSRLLDQDHVDSYDPLGPPGQTGDHNDAPLARHSHRAKTHLGYKVEQLGLGIYLWTTPNGLIRLVNHTGTHEITELHAEFLRIIHGP